MGANNDAPSAAAATLDYSLPVLVILALAAALLWTPTDSALAQDAITRPKITAGPAIVSSPESGDTYRAGEATTVEVTFNEAVTVTGKPRLRLIVGSEKRWARYSGSEGDDATLTFSYTIKAADRDDDGISTPKNGIRLNGGSIEDADGNAARLKHPALPDQGSHKVDGSPANNEPQFAHETAARSVSEIWLPGLYVGDPVTAEDADDDALTYALTGSDAFIAIADTGQIFVAAGADIDYEAQAEYTVTVTVHDGKNAAGEADTNVDATIEVTIAILNVDEPGTVALDPHQPQALSSLRAILSDPDGDVSSVSWVWERSADGTAWDVIAGAAHDAYTPATDDVGSYLRATASYADGHGPSKSARAATANPVAGIDYDSDDDGLISVATQEQLAAVTLDLDGDGASDSENHAGEYRRAFPVALAVMGCPKNTGCAGYELDGSLTLTGEWHPIGANGTGFTGTFDGNGNTISGLSIRSVSRKNTDSTSSALFARLDAGGVIRNIGVVGPNIDHSFFSNKRSNKSSAYFSGLVGYNQGTISESYVSDGTISVRGGRCTVGGLVGYNQGTIRNGHASASVSTTRGALNTVGGLVGRNTGTIRDSHANASVSTSVSEGNTIGGLVGRNQLGGTVSNSRASGSVKGDGRVGGLVGWLSNGAISNSQASGNVSANGNGSSVGGLVGHSQNQGNIRDSHASGNVSASGGRYVKVGGLVGWNQDAYITDSHASGKASASGSLIGYVGGLVGWNERGSISKSQASGSVSARGGGDQVGGLVGQNKGSISNSYASGKVSARAENKDYVDKVGGLVGQNDRGSSIRNSYASGRVSEDGDYAANVGGLVGQNDDGTVSNSYWDKKATGVTTSDGSPKRAGKTTKEMKMATGPSSSIYTGWDTSIWNFSDTDAYPTLR